MVAAILGKKIGMTQVFDPTGVRVPVTLVEAGPCVILQIKRADGPDGYNAVQLGFADVKPHRASLPEIGRARRARTSPKAFVREIRLSEPTDKVIGDAVTVELFQQQNVKYVDISGTSKGKGFQGGMKRWGFGGQSASHGTERKHRSLGSIGGRAAERGRSGCIKKGKKMAGHMGNVLRTVRNQPLLAVDAEHNLLVIRGAIPGPRNGFVIVRRSKAGGAGE